MPASTRKSKKTQEPDADDEGADLPLDKSPPTKGKAKKATKAKPNPTVEGTSDKENVPPNGQAASDTPPPKTNSKRKPDAISEDSDDDDEPLSKKAKVAPKTKAKGAKVPPSLEDEDVPERDDDEEPPKKKQKKSDPKPPAKAAKAAKPAQPSKASSSKKSADAPKGPSSQPTKPDRRANTAKKPSHSGSGDSGPSTGQKRKRDEPPASANDRQKGKSTARPTRLAELVHEQGTKTPIPRPKGEPGEPGNGGYTIKDEMLMSDPEQPLFGKEYTAIQKTIRELILLSRIPITKPLRDQDITKLAKIYSLAVVRHPYVNTDRFPSHWPLAAMVKMFLRYCRQKNRALQAAIEEAEELFKKVKQGLIENPFEEDEEESEPESDEEEVPAPKKKSKAKSPSPAESSDDDAEPAEVKPKPKKSKAIIESDEEGDFSGAD